MLGGERFAQFRIEHAVFAVIAADFALQGAERVFPFGQGGIIPSLDGRRAQAHPISGERVAPLLPGQLPDSSGQFAPGGGSGQELPDHAKAEPRPALVGSTGGRIFCHWTFACSGFCRFGGVSPQSSDISAAMSPGILCG